MASNSLSSIAEYFQTVGCYLLGSTRISRSSSLADYNSIVMGLTLWFGVVLDYNDRFCNTDEARTNRGRLFKSAINGFSQVEVPLDGFLSYLDQLSDILLKNISDESGFKAMIFLTELKNEKCLLWLNPLKGILHSILSSAFANEGEDEVWCVRAARQLFCFLKKLDITRADLVESSEQAFFEFEEYLSYDSIKRSHYNEYQLDVFDMKTLLDKHISDFTVEPFTPGHGPGAVSQSSCKCWYDKHTNACLDARIGYLLDHACLGRQSDYLPLVTESNSSRTSRYICVPKTWKKLRGISAEPIELQFFQHGVEKAIDRMFQQSFWWRSRVNLHSQQTSRDLALMGSITGEYATVDLSAASDSVSLQLVCDLFGNSHLGRWLRGTRSVFTTCRDTTIRIHKFAPMGSACCFPVECMIFALAATVAVNRTWTPSCNTREVRVFGDDIIVPTYAVSELLKILDHLGFSVNTEKSFWKGSFREACGIEAWRGHDISPCRFRKWHSGIRGRRTDYDELSSGVAFMNELYVRGLHETRAFLVDVILSKGISLPGCPRLLPASMAIFATFSGERSTFASPQPTNFHLRRKFDRSLQTSVWKMITWQIRPKSKVLLSEMSDNYDVCKYTEWLLQHQVGVADFDDLWSDGWIDSRATSPWSRLPLGTTMVPTVKWVLRDTANSLRCN